MKIFFSVGEPSGDLHGANLIGELARLRPNLQATGFGGPRMAAAGCDLLQDMTELAVMGLLPALVRLPQFLQLVGRAREKFQTDRPDAVVLIDFPGFNWHIAKAAKSLGIPVFYYGLPQVWAWATWRVKKVRNFVDHALVKLPFEEQWFRDRGCNATYVGHPYFDELRTRKLDANFAGQMNGDPRRLVTILPGSRNQEVRDNLPTLLKAAAIVNEKVPGLRFAIASYNEPQAARARELVAAAQLPAEVFVGRTPELIEAAHVCLACSGSVSLELLYHAKPSVILYKVGWLTYQIVRQLMSSRYITLVNLLATEQIASTDREPYNAADPAHANVLFPEYPTWQDKSREIAAHAVEWLTDEAARQQSIARLEDLRGRVAAGGASRRAAEYIAARLPEGTSATSAIVSRPHFESGPLAARS
jgi:lipid-A-disaccharide synthase